MHLPHHTDVALSDFRCLSVVALHGVLHADSFIRKRTHLLWQTPALVMQAFCFFLRILRVCLEKWVVNIYCTFMLFVTLSFKVEQILVWWRWIHEALIEGVFASVIGSSRRPTAKYTKVGERLRHVIPGHMQCSMACGGRACKYENPARWSDQEQAIKGLYSSW